MIGIAAFQWNIEVDQRLKALLGQGMSIRAVAKEIGAHRTQVVRRIEKLGLNEEKHVPHSANGSHIERYKRARRGFDVPVNLEPEYLRLLKTGMPIADVCRKLGIVTNQPRGE